MLFLNWWTDESYFFNVIRLKYLKATVIKNSLFYFNCIREVYTGHLNENLTASKSETVVWSKISKITSVFFGKTNFQIKIMPEISSRAVSNYLPYFFNGIIWHASHPSITIFEIGSFVYVKLNVEQLNNKRCVLVVFIENMNKTNKWEQTE